jgi:hypothetical protein
MQTFIESPIAAAPGARQDPPVQRLAADRQAAAAYIVGLYLELLDRVPGEAELADWTDEILRGLPPEQARQGFLDSAEYRDRQARIERREAIEGTGLFDADWYLHQYSDVAASGWDPLDHYARHGNAEDRAPNGYFAPAWYREQAGLDAEADPLLHYVQQGEGQNLPPGPDFDPAWYRSAHRLDAATSPLLHFLRHRQHGQVAPCARLWSVLSLPDQGGSATYGDRFLRFLAACGPGDWPASADRDLIEASGLFDANYYALHSADVLEAEMDPLTHFCRFGWQEGRNPSFYFNTAWYTRTNVSVGRLAVNPLLHYLLVGEPAGRRPVIYFDPAWYRAAYDIPAGVSSLAHYLAHRRTQTYAPVELFDPAHYIAHSASPVHRNRDPFTHFLIAGMQRDVPPSSRFDMTAWRRQTRGRSTRYFRHLLTPERDNPLVDYLLSTYR